MKANAKFFVSIFIIFTITAAIVFGLPFVLNKNRALQAQEHYWTWDMISSVVVKKGRYTTTTTYKMKVPGGYIIKTVAIYLGEGISVHQVFIPNN